MSKLITNASWITYAGPEDAPEKETKNPWETALGAEDQFAPIVDAGGIALFRKTFSVKDLKSARIDVTALGVFDIYINGKRAGLTNGRYDELKPGWSDYDKRVLYYSYDIAEYLTDGENTILAAVAPGWYNGRISLGTYGDTHIGFLADIEVADGISERNIVTDATWEASWGSAIRAADIWDGELYDANEASLAAISLKKDNLTWNASTEEERSIEITSHIGTTIQTRPELARTPESITIYKGTDDNGSDYGKIHVLRTGSAPDFSLKEGESAVVDFGQNMVGWPCFKVSGAKNTTIQFRFGEMLNDSGLKSRGNDNPEGSIYSINYRSAKAKIYYILNGEGKEYYNPTFTFFGFRYCEITATADIEIESLSAMVVGSANTETGCIETSHPDVNRLISNIRWGQRGNYFSVPTDCPQRDERLGWTGDTQAFCGTASYNADVAGFFHKWLQDARDSQADNGMYPDVIPHSRVVGYGGAAWSDAGIIVPYTIWKMYADTDIISEHYDSMEKYMGWLKSRGMAGPNPTYGDWLAYEGTDAKYISICYYALDARYMAIMSDAIGKTERAGYYNALYSEIREAFRANCCTDSGELKPEFRSQTGYLLALRNNLLDEGLRADAVASLKNKIIDNGYKLSTGFVGACILNEILAEEGENNLAYSLLLQTEDPSWLYSVHQGATTIWERWNSYTKANGFGPVGMNSFNHYAYGSVQEWMYRHIAGIETTVENPGFAHPILQPKPDTRTPDEIPAGQEKITWVKSSFNSRAGMIVSDWDMRNGFEYNCEVPAASTLYLPVLTDSDKFILDGKPRSFSDYEKKGNTIIIELDAGRHCIKE